MTSNEITAIANAAKELAAANKRRHKGYQFATPNEEAALQKLEWVISVSKKAKVAA